MFKLRMYKPNITETRDYILVGLDPGLEKLSDFIKSKKDEGIYIMPGLQVGIRMLMYDKKHYNKKQVKRFIKELYKKECPLCKGIKEELIKAFEGRCN